MVCPGVMLTLIICEIFLAWVPLDIVCILCNFITNPKILHFHRTRALLFEGVVCNTHSSGVVAQWMGVFGLLVAGFFKGQINNHTFLAIYEEGTKFGLSCGSNDKT